MYAVKMAWILRVLFFFELARTFVQSSDWIDDVTQYIAEESGARQVMVITTLEENKGIASPKIDEVLVNLGQKLPVMKINIADQQDVPDTSCVNDAGHPIPLTSEATFFLLIHDFRDTGKILPSTSFIDAVAEMASFDYHPRYLMLFVAPVLSESLEELLQYAWTKKMLDLTILQWVEKRVSEHFKIEKYEFSLPIVHHLNPFKQEYRRSNWSLNSGGLFPNKVDNMAGYSLRALVSDSPPFTVAVFSESDEPIIVDGVNVRILQLIARKLNASLKYIPYKLAEGKKIKSRNSHTYYYAMGEHYKFDISAYLHARVSSSRCSSLLTTTIVVNELCAVVPILSTSASFHSTDLISAVLFSFAIVVIYWIAASVLRLSVRVRRPFIIARVFFGVSVSPQPRRTVERIMLTSLLVISSIYSANIYNALTGISLLTTGEMPFESITDLDNSGLIPLVNPLYFNKTFCGAEGSLKNLMEKSMMSLTGMNSCIQQLVGQKNVTCFMDKSRAEILVARSTTNGHPMMKLAKPCFWSDSASFSLGKRSPYRSSIIIMIGQLQNAGLINKLYEDVKHEEIKRNDDKDIGVLEGQQSMIALRHQFLTLAIVCYTISLLVLIGEIVVHRVLKLIESKRQEIVHIPYTE